MLRPVSQFPWDIRRETQARHGQENQARGLGLPRRCLSYGSFGTRKGAATRQRLKAIPRIEPPPCRFSTTLPRG